MKTAVARAGTNTNSSTYVVVVTMRLERYFSTLLEEKSQISNDVTDMIEDKNYFNIFTTCGANYVRSIRRGQEVTAVFNYESNDDEKAKAFADSLRLFAYGNDMEEVWEHGHNSSEVVEVVDTDSSEGIALDANGAMMEASETPNYDFSDILGCLVIEMTAFGLGPNDDGAGDIVATSLDEFKEAMKSSFRSMTQEHDGGGEVGLVYVMEVVPWANNAEFLILSEISEDNNELNLPVPSRLIEKAPCVSASFVQDEFGKCCKVEDRVKTTTGEDKCEPNRSPPSAIMRDNMELNAEFVSWLGYVVQQKTQTLTTVGQCVIGLRSLPEQYDFYLLDSGASEMDLTVQELRMALDPMDDLNLLKMLSKERDEYLESFYEPCLSALYGVNLGDTRETDPIYFTALPWYNHKECMRVSCLQQNMAWDRKDGQHCVDGVLRHTTDTPIPTENDRYCCKVLDVDSGESICEYTPDPNVIQRMDQCRENLPPTRDGRGGQTPASIEYLIEHFCVPEIDFIGGRVDANRMFTIDIATAICKGDQIPLFPSSSPSSESFSAGPTQGPTTEVTNEASQNPTQGPTTKVTNEGNGCESVNCQNEESGYQVCKEDDPYSYCVCESPYNEPTSRPVSPGTKCCPHSSGPPGRVVTVMDIFPCPE